jgi:phosphoribulokinase
LYTFPDFRMKFTDMTDGFRVTCSLINKLIEINNYDCYLITMQNRPRGGKRWWDTWVKHMSIASNDMWYTGSGYIQTCNHSVQKCWQNYVYTNDEAFKLWNPNLITHTEWESLPEGK